MAEKLKVDVTVAQEFSADAPVLNLVESVEYFFAKLGVSDFSYRNPLKKATQVKKSPG